RGPLEQEVGRGGAGLLVDVVGVVVLDLVVVPDRRPRRGRVHRLRGRVGLVLGVPRAVVGQRRELGGRRAGLRRRVHAAGTRRVARAVLVDVVAEVEDEVVLLERHLAVGRE